MRRVLMESVSFPAADGHCLGVLYRPDDAPGRIPVIVMAHGFSGTRLTQYDRRARRLVESGAAVLDYDNRFVGMSPGEPRQRIDARQWLVDLRAAVAYVRSRPDIDRESVGLYGSSMGGALAFAVAADDPRIKAIALDVPALDGLKLTPAPLSQRPRLMAAVAKDFVARTRRKPRVTLPAFGAVGSGAVLQHDVDGFWKAMDEIDGLEWVEPKVHVRHPETGQWRNEATALDLLNLLQFRPARRAADVSCPVLAHVADDDKVVPYRATRRSLERAANCDIRVLRGGHFAPFYGEGFEQTVATQIAYFASELPKLSAAMG